MALVPRTDKSVITVTVDDRDLGSFMQRSGGAADSEETLIRPGGAEEQVSLGGPKTQENVIVRKLYDQPMRDNREWLESRRGSGKMKVTDQPLDGDDNPYGAADHYRGTFKKFTPPDRDVNGNEAAVCELEMTAARTEY